MKISTGLPGLVVVAVWSFSWTYTVGHLGLFAFDQSLVFDGGWRIFSGQVPYKDFLMAFGPLAFALQALFFKLCGVNWTAMVVSAATMDVLAALSVMRTMTRLFGRERRGLVFFSGLLMGTAFQPIFGTLWIEQVAFLFFLLGIQALCETRERRSLGQYLGYAAAGVCAVLAFLGKQNVGALAAVSLGIFVLAAAPLQPRALLKAGGAYLLGCVLVAGLFYAWLVVYSDVHLFVHHALQAPSQAGNARIANFLSFYLPSLTPTIPQACDALAILAVVLSVIHLLRTTEARQRFLADANLRLALVLTAAIPVIQMAFQATSYQDEENTLFLPGFSLCLAVGLLGRLIAQVKPRILLATVGCAIGISLFVQAVYCSWHRTVQNSFPPGAVPSRYLQVAPLARLRWMTPTYSHYTTSALPSESAAREIKPTDVENTYTYLTAQKQPFFLLGDSSYLYGITGQVPPGPLLYFQPDHYWTEADVPGLDDWTLLNLKKAHVSLIVREKHLFFANGFPFSKTKKWVEDNFHPGPIFGEFEILVRTTGD